MGRSCGDCVIQLAAPTSTDANAADLLPSMLGLISHTLPTAADQEGSLLPPPAHVGPPAREYPFKLDPFQQVQCCATSGGQRLRWLPPLPLPPLLLQPMVVVVSPAQEGLLIVGNPRLMQTAVNALEAGHSVLVAAHTSGEAASQEQSMACIAAAAG